MQYIYIDWLKLFIRLLFFSVVINFDFNLATNYELAFSVAMFPQQFCEVFSSVQSVGFWISSNLWFNCPLYTIYSWIYFSMILVWIGVETTAAKQAKQNCCTIVWNQARTAVKNLKYFIPYFHKNFQQYLSGLESILLDIL